MGKPYERSLKRRSQLEAKRKISFSDLLSLGLPADVFAKIVEEFFIDKKSVPGRPRILLFSEKEGSSNAAYEVRFWSIFQYFFYWIPDRKVVISLLKIAAKHDRVVELEHDFNEVEKKARREWSQDEKLILKLVKQCRRQMQRVQKRIGTFAED